MNRPNNNSTTRFWIDAIFSSLIIYYCSFNAISIAQDEKERRCVWILYIIYIPLIGDYLIILQKKFGIIFINNKYLIYQAIVFGFNYIASIAYNLCIKIYKGWLNFLLLLSVNILLIFIYSFTNVGDNEDIKENNVGFNRLLLLSFLMIIYISIFNSEVIDKIKYSPVYLSIIFGYIPFFIIFSLVIFILILGIIILAFGLLLVIFIIIIFLIFIVSLITTNKYLE